MDLKGSVALVVEKDRAVRDLVAMCLEDMDMRVVTVATLEEGAKALEQTRLDLVITGDFAEPIYRKGAKWPMVELLQQHSVDVPVIGITDWPDALSENPKDLGIDDLISKPFDVIELQRRVEGVMEARERSDS